VKRRASPARLLSWCTITPRKIPPPSQEDIRGTEQLIEAGKLLDIEVLDHVIVAQSGFLSLNESGLGFE
jgi:DNA repair protein RadC